MTENTERLPSPMPRRDEVSVRVAKLAKVEPQIDVPEQDLTSPSANVMPGAGIMYVAGFGW